MSPPRCYFDGVFYRVFCFTLLATAFAFTVILTDVFVDLDALLAGKSRISQQEAKNNEVKFHKQMKHAKVETQTEENDEDYKQDEDDVYRTKRSLDSSTFQFHLKSPKMKQILTNRLNTLLEELDTEETTTTNKGTEKVSEENNKNENQIEINQDQKSTEFKKNEDMLHLTLHNILLKGILGHMDVNEVYGQIHTLIGKFFKGQLKKTSDESTDKDAVAREHKFSEIPPSLTKVEAKFFEELVKCKELQNQVKAVTKRSILKPYTSTVRSIFTDPKLLRDLGLKVIKSKTNKTGTDVVKKTKVNPMLIKTVIDITTANDEQGNNMLTSDESSVKGMIKLIYNGKSIKLSNSNVETTTIATTASSIENKTVEPDIIQENGNILLTESLISKALREYVKKHKIIQRRHKNRSKSSERQSKRLKRNIKLKVNSQFSTHESITRSPKPNTEKKEVKPKKDDDELFVEIETHFDSKGIKGEKKKKLIKNIVEKIQQAIRSDMDGKGKKHKTGVPRKAGHILKIRKRYQNPLSVEENKLMNKLIVPLDKIINRQMEPISKSIILGENMPKVYDKMGESWTKKHIGPSFLSSAKSINSGEMGGINLDYSKVMRNSGIPQRLQQPLNGEILDENGNAYFDVGDLKFVIKEVDGTGFSIGFNQYVGAAPDPENVKLFSGLQQILKSYDNYDPNDITTERNFEDFASYERMHDISHEGNHEIVKRNAKREIRADFDDDDHSNEYQTIFDQKYLPYDNYQEIFEDRKKKVTVSVQRERILMNDSYAPENSIELNNLGVPIEVRHPHRIPETRNRTKEIIIDDNIFEKKLNPSQIFILANLLTRKKRSLTVNNRLKTFTKKIRPGMSTYIKKRPITSKVFYKNNNKRIKRQVDKIRIIASDGMPNIQRNSDENLYVVSGENVLADRAIRDEMTETEPVNELEKPTEERFEYVDPYAYSAPKSAYANIFSSKSRHNMLMSKYPHILMEELTRSKEDYSDKEEPMILGKYITNFGDINLDSTTHKFIPTSIDTPVGPAVQDLSDALVPHSNYKLTVKIIPKNETDHHPGFKEVHTSINKSVNKNGVVFSSQMNISEISKVENYEKEMELLHKGNFSKHTTASPLVKHLKEQQEQMKKILQQHRLKIDEQLDHLKKEKQNLESIIVPGKPAIRDSDGIDVYIPLNPPQMLHLNKVEAGQLISSALMKLHDIPQLNDVVNNSCSQTTTTERNVPITTESTTIFTTTTSTTTTPSPPPPPPPPPPTTTTTSTTERTTTTRYIPPIPTHHVPRVDPDRLRILRTIQRNENLTHAILSKIDRNTDLLQTFLQKLTDKIDPETKHEEPKTEKTIETTTHESPIINIPSHAKMHNVHYPYPKEWGRQFIDPNFYRNMQLHNMQNSLPNGMQIIPNGMPNGLHHLQIQQNGVPNGLQNMPNIQQMHNIPNIPMPNLQNINTEEGKNETELSIPFVYAYQNPYPVVKPSNQPMASIIYQGHIHTNPIKNMIKDGHIKETPHLKHMNNKQETLNQTRFFLDDLDPVAVGMNLRSINTTAT